MHQEWNFKSGTEHLCLGTTSLHHLCLYIWLSSSNWVICPSGNLPERLFLPPNHSDISFFIDLFLKESNKVRCTSTLNRSRSNWRFLHHAAWTPGKHFLLLLAYQRWYDYAELAAFCPWRTFVHFFFGCTSAETLVRRLQPWSVPRGNGWGLGLELFKAPGSLCPWWNHFTFYILSHLTACGRGISAGSGLVAQTTKGGEMGR